ncbi:hypothetical protein DU63_08105 [Methanosarcina mazei]|uniref:Uncharacterized protein n=1 Tax=Methanosarcina mazei TaxID=2209 RepID=A0A0F8H659_METMZ|nr:hypothetical protein DU63_08105 [Methanosarcina mazei]
MPASLQVVQQFHFREKDDKKKTFKTFKLKHKKFITTGAQRVTNTPSFTGCPAITYSNCWIPSLGWGGRTQFDLFPIVIVGCLL